MWIELKSLDKDAKRKYIFYVFLLAGAILFGIHLAAVGGLGIEVNEEVSPSPVLVIVRVLSLTFMLVAAWLYKDFFATQDELTDIMNLCYSNGYWFSFCWFSYFVHILIIKLLFMSILLVLPLGQLLVDIDSIKNLSVNGKFNQAIKRANGYKPSRFG